MPQAEYDAQASGGSSERAAITRQRFRFPLTTTTKNEIFDLSVTAEAQTIARYLQLMDTNEPPAAAELAYTRAVVSKTAAQLASLDEDIIKLKTRLKELEDGRSVLAVSHQRSLPIISPLRRMPPEILSEIFVWTLPLPADGFPAVKPQWLLSHAHSY
ncbi:hypothetical protein FB45DRAFT_1010679 [Roridomyces roridus]|uniref:Uncharacterized protein n=1 Tax=Roridomyces roridus TaxID=1738132 RepID=A0AAD7FAX8_9AGAR|nr:hypothetical protein FB45DRAFT_1010679 [Roridomyces roridus]